ncbi:4Fe-4S dicluster domain-containing protein [Bacillus sp. B15-48]|uniref:4Fe-4S dicluster domain-containing protein n=1 Tax=Bacillus sp. B15-48 TaxID=1548601 RepID=UPI00193FB5DD|nr:4Fe-4S dicluster domain-containing protein [Bacillus sp. B15-48]MBM4761058.1 4Fe-4S dicluster domain-containing protein [Bacillus sp. B15-48]
MAEKKQYGMVIDRTKCIGCQTCIVACKLSNGTPKGVYWSKLKIVGSEVFYYGPGEFSKPLLQFEPQQCNHCENPPCVENCPTNAMYKREDGIVQVNEANCIGCEYCTWHCPYNAPVIDSVKGKMSKCHFCVDRLESEEAPYCVEACPTDARLVGLISDPTSDISKVIAEKNAKPLKPEYGTKPSVYYI